MTKNSFVAEVTFKYLKCAQEDMLLWALQRYFFKLGFTPCKAEQPLMGMKLQEKKAQKD